MATVKQMHNEAFGEYYLVENKNGVKLTLSPYGARSLELILPAADGERDILVGPKTIADYKENSYYNATIGPVAGRIAGAKFELNGVTYETEDSQAGNTLHGGLTGYDKQMFSGETFEAGDKAGVIFTFTDPAGAHGFPGNVQVKVTYTLTDDNEYSFAFDAETDQATLFNPTNHGYYNLTGSPANKIDEHTLEVRASKVGETNDDVTTTGNTVDVEGTKFDFLGGVKFGDTRLDDPFILDDNSQTALILTSPDEKVAIELTTTEPAIVIYTTGTGEAGSDFKHGLMVDHGSVAIEPQGVPGTEIYPQFGSITLEPGKPFFAESTFKLKF